MRMKYADAEMEYMKADAELRVARRELEAARVRVTKAEEWRNRAAKPLLKAYTETPATN
jgi:hypothetical protein